MQMRSSCGLSANVVVGNICMPPPALTGSSVFQMKMDVGVRELGEDLVRTRHIELGEIREEKKANLESHGESGPFVIGYGGRLWGANSRVKVGVCWVKCLGEATLTRNDICFRP